MTKWTPEPWEVDEFRVDDWRIKKPDGKGGCWWIAEVSGSPDNAEANASRITSCINALAGLNPEGVRELVDAVWGVMEYEDALQNAAGGQETFDRLRTALATVRLK